LPASGAVRRGFQLPQLSPRFTPTLDQQTAEQLSTVHRRKGGGLHADHGFWLSLSAATVHRREGGALHADHSFWLSLSAAGAVATGSEYALGLYFTAVLDDTIYEALDLQHHHWLGFIVTLIVALLQTVLGWRSGSLVGSLLFTAYHRQLEWTCGREVGPCTLATVSGWIYKSDRRPGVLLPRGACAPLKMHAVTGNGVGGGFAVMEDPSCRARLGAEYIRDIMA
jgi:hypothetical protein